MEEEGEKRLIVNMPPQHGKSRAVCEEFVSYLLGHDPSQDIVLAGYGMDLPVKNCKRLRARIQSSTYRTLFPKTMLSEDTRTQTFWTTSEGGGVRAVGIGTGLTGNRATTLIIDDPHKDRAEAESSTIRAKVWDWYASTAMTRLAPNSTIILIMTRWHEDDLCGMLTSSQHVDDLLERGHDDQVFRVVNLPALCEDADDLLGRKIGESLWPENKDEKFIASRKSVLGDYEYNALYRGNPISRGGNIVNLDQIGYVSRKDLPEGVEFVRSWDLAATTKKTSDYSASALCGYDKTEDVFYVADVFRRRMNWHETKTTIGSYADRERNRLGIEAVGGFITAYEQIKAERMGRNVVQSISVSKDKLARANGWLSMIDAGKFRMVRGDWNYEFIDELRAFPDSKHDDQVDAVSLGYEMTYKKGGKLLMC